MEGRSGSILTVAVGAAAVSTVLCMLATWTSIQAADSSLKTPWGEPDLQGIWTEVRIPI
jgi:hypothetical protein